VRGTSRGILSCLALLALSGAILAGCEAKSHENKPRPPVIPVLSVSVSGGSIEVAPRGLGIPGEQAINLNQNADAPTSQADPLAPLIANVRFSNLTARDTRLVLEGPVDRVVPMAASAPGSFTVGLETGIYRFSSPASAGTRRFFVGPSRPSSASDLLTP
jgi:hypothetical protein